MNPNGPFLSRDRDLALAYDARPVLRDLHLEFRRGERWVLLGPNGAGKSTYLKSFLQPGLVRGGQRECAVAPSARVLLSQQSRLSWSVPCRVREFLISSLALNRGIFAKLETAELQRIDEALADAGLSSVAGQFLAELSGGQVQKLLLARALLMNAEMLLLDEPFSAIDRDGKEELWRRLDQCLPSTCQILVLHDVLDILRSKARLLEAREGSLREIPFDEYRSTQERLFNVVLSR